MGGDGKMHQHSRKVNRIQNQQLMMMVVKATAVELEEYYNKHNCVEKEGGGGKDHDGHENVESDAEKEEKEEEEEDWNRRVQEQG